MSLDLDDPRRISALDWERLRCLDHDPVEVLGQVLFFEDTIEALENGAAYLH